MLPESKYKSGLQCLLRNWLSPSQTMETEDPFKGYVRLSIAKIPCTEIFNDSDYAPKPNLDDGFASSKFKEFEVPSLITMSFELVAAAT
ncbi:MAG: hypothetical protein Q9171_000601 [Xanthocarpia ochracea]